MNSQTNPLQIALCPPQFEPFQQAMSGERADATYLIQKHIATVLTQRGHKLTYLAPQNLDRIICTTQAQNSVPAPQTWSASGWFTLLHKVAWRGQQLLGVPYLNVFSNYQLMDAALRCLPGHDLVYERNALYKTGIAMACKRLKMPYILFVESDEVMEYDFMGRPITGILRRRAKNMIAYNLNAAGGIVCVSEALKNHLVNEWRIPAEKIAVFPNGVEVDRFKPDPEARARIRALLGIGSKPMVLFVGNFYEWHDVTTLLNSFKQLLTSYPEAQLVLVGDGNNRQAMERHAIELGLAPAVHFTGLVPYADVPGYTSAADVAVAPVPDSIRDMWLSPLKVFEYMSAGTAVVASSIGHLAEVIENGQNGLLVPPGDATALTAALEKLLGQETLRLRLGQQARADAVREHSWDHYFSRLERVFNAVIAGQPVAWI